ncbi:MAG TPA: metallophosphoesterase [Nitrososphaeraceae archaeon]|jgi:putative phosphoesterase
MIIGLISDTHDNVEKIQRAIKEFGNRSVELILHAGDFVSPTTVESFSGFKVVGVRGNNDVDVSGLALAFKKINGELIDEILDTTYDGLRFAMYHGTNYTKRESLIKSGKFDVVIYGHTHRKIIKKCGKTLIVNPGTAKGWVFGRYATAAVLDTTNRNVDFFDI